MQSRMNFDMPTRKTRKMIAVEVDRNLILEEYLPKRITDQGLTATAKELGITNSTLGIWLLKMGIRTQRIALAPGDSLEIRRA